MTDPCAAPPVETPKLILSDYYMPVVGTGISFVACVPGYLRDWGVQFLQSSIDASQIRAASTLAHMGMVRGFTFRFIREGAKLTTAQAASIVGVTVPEIDVWEAEVLEVPRLSWQHMADYVAKLDGKIGLVDMQIPPPDYRSRVIRVVPDIIQVSNQPVEASNDCGCT